MKNYDDWLAVLAISALIISLVALLLAVLSLSSAPASASVPGDVDGDGHVNATDFSLLASAYLAYPASMRVNPAANARWDPRADFNRDGQVTCLDLSLLILHYGE